MLPLESVARRDPIYCCKPRNEMHPVAWLKMMMGTRRVMSAEGVFGSVLLCKTYVISEGLNFEQQEQHNGNRHRGGQN